MHIIVLLCSKLVAITDWKSCFDNKEMEALNSQK